MTNCIDSSGIDLQSHAAAQGHELDPWESWRGSAVMRHPNGDKIIVTRNAANEHYVYFSVRDERDHGTIVDFIERRKSLNLGQVRKELRPWVGRTSSGTLPWGQG